MRTQIRFWQHKLENMKSQVDAVASRMDPDGVRLPPSQDRSREFIFEELEECVDLLQSAWECLEAIGRKEGGHLIVLEHRLLRSSAGKGKESPTVADD